MACGMQARVTSALPSGAGAGGAHTVRSIPSSAAVSEEPDSEMDAMMDEAEDAPGPSQHALQLYEVSVPAAAGRLQCAG